MKIKKILMDYKYLISLVVLISSQAIADPISKWTDADGKVHYSDQPPASAQSKQLRINSGGGSLSEGASSGSARISDASAVPYLSEKGRAAYLQFLSHPNPRAFYVCPNGSFGTVYVNGNYPEKLKTGLAHRPPGCEPYVINDAVVWTGK